MDLDKCVEIFENFFTNPSFLQMRETTLKAIEFLERENREEKWRTDPLGLMWIFSFKVDTLRYGVADFLRAIASFIEPD